MHAEPKFISCHRGTARRWAFAALAASLFATVPAAQAQFRVYVGLTSQGFPITVYANARNGNLQMIVDTVAMPCEQAGTLLNPFVYSNGRRRGDAPVTLRVDDFSMDVRGSMQFSADDTRLSGQFNAAQASFVDVQASVSEVNRCASGVVSFDADWVTNVSQVQGPGARR